MNVRNLILKLISHLLPVRQLDRICNSSLPKSDRAFKKFSQIDPTFFEYVSAKKLLYIFRKAAISIPAYADYLKKAEVHLDSIREIYDFNTLVPQTSKKKYVNKYSLNERCYHGVLPMRGVLEESAGTSCNATVWLKSKEEEEGHASMTLTTLKYLYGLGEIKNYIVINGLLMGGWAGGFRFAERFEKLSVVRNTGPDPQKIINCLKEFGTGYTFLIGAYPPFIIELISFGKRLNDFSWNDYRIHILTCGEGFAEGWRSYVASQLAPGALIYSVYGAIDIDVGISTETPFSVAVRKLMIDDASLRQKLLSSSRLPCFLGQYSPLKFYISEKVNPNDQKELEFTLLNLKSPSPNLKYNIEDEGGIIRFDDVCTVLNDSGYSVSEIKKDNNIRFIIPFPFIYIFGRSDGTISLNGAMISPSEISEALLSEQELAEAIDTFKLHTGPDADQFVRLYVTLAARKDSLITETLSEKCRMTILNHLLKVNECFKKAYMGNPALANPVVKVIANGSGLFAEDRESVKHHYIIP